LELEQTPPGNWRTVEIGPSRSFVAGGYYNFNHHEPKAPTAKLQPKSECAFCHMASAKKDDVWTQFYPLLDN